MKKLIPCLLLWLCCGLSGCYSEKKASQQTEKAADEYPDVVANIARKYFPCVSTDSSVTETTDSTKWIASRDSALKELSKTKHSLADAINALSKLPESVQDTCKEYADIINLQQKEILRMNGIIETFQPIIKYREVKIKVEDSAKIRLLLADINKLATELKKETDDKNKWKEKYEALKDKWRGKIGIPWWIFLIIGAGLVLFMKRAGILSLFK